MNLSDLTSRLPAYLQTRGAALVAVAALQIGALGYMVADRIHLIKSGREIELPIVPVDPRDLFKGDYVQLGFPISTIPIGLAATIDLKQAKVAYVTLQQQADASWTPVQVSARYPDKTGPAQIVLRARPPHHSGWSPTAMNMRYGIERYYVPEGKGGDLEKLARQKKLAAIVAVDGRGNAAIKGLSTDGRRVYDEPLF